MIALARYLAPLRSNPGYAVEWRHAEGGPWLAMASARSRKDATSELASPMVALTLGDLVRVRDPNGTVVDFSVQTDAGLVVLPSGGDRPLRRVMLTEAMANWYRDCGYDWGKAWDDNRSAVWLLRLAGWVGVDQRLLVQAACDCAETALPYVPAGEDRPRVAIETARRWAQGEAMPEEVLDALYAVSDVAIEAAGVVAWAAQAATCATEAATWDRTAWDIAAEAARCATVAFTRDGAEPAPMAPMVRRRIPLWRFALALAARVPT